VIQGPTPICLHCRRFWNADDLERDGFYCDAFPYEPGIPDEIINGSFDHTKPHPADNGIRFEPITAKAPQ
jgi:hypothetical protein